MASDFLSRCARRSQFAGSHLLTSLLSFNLGVELGQLLVLALLIPAFDLLFRHAIRERLGVIILGDCGRYRRALDCGAMEQSAQPSHCVAGSGALPSALDVVRWVAAIVIAGGLWLALDEWRKRRQRSDAGI